MRRRSVFPLFLAAVLSAGLSAQVPSASEAAKILPKDALGWTAAGDQTYDAETVFDYIDGAGEVYRAYNMKALLSRRFRKAGGPDIIADLFDMGTSADACGVFTHDLDGEAWPLGQAALYKGGLLTMWRGRWFAALFAEAETEEAKAALREMGRRIAAAIGTDGAKPALLGLLPPGYADPGRARFLHSPVILRYHLSLPGDNPLMLDGRTDAALGKAADKSVLLAVLYPGEASAEAALRSARAALLPGAELGRAARAADGSWAAAGRRGAVLALAWKAASAEASEAAVAGALARAAEISTTRRLP